MGKNISNTVNLAFNGQVGTNDISLLYAKSITKEIDLMNSKPLGLKISSFVCNYPLYPSPLYARFTVSLYYINHFRFQIAEHLR